MSAVDEKLVELSHDAISEAPSLHGVSCSCPVFVMQRGRGRNLGPSASTKDRVNRCTRATYAAGREPEKVVRRVGIEPTTQ